MLPSGTEEALKIYILYIKGLSALSDRFDKCYHGYHEPSILVSNVVFLQNLIVSIQFIF